MSMLPPLPSASDRRASADLLRDPDRLSALRKLDLLGAPSKEAFDRLTRLAARFLATPVSLVTLVEEDRQLFLGQTGLPEPWASRREMPLEYSYCRHALGSETPLLIEDAREDRRVQGSPAISENRSIAYVGVPLLTQEGHALGTLCVVDQQPRTWTAEEVQILRDLAASVMTEIELRRDIIRRRLVEEALQTAHDRLEDEVRERTAELRQSEQRFRALVEHGAEIITVLAVDGTIRYESPAVERVLGRSAEGMVGQIAFRGVHPSDLPRAEIAFTQAVEEAAPVSTELRIRHRDGSWRVLQVTGMSLLGERAVAGVVVNSRDMTELRQGEERLRQAQRTESVGRLAAGIAHDFNNILTTITGTAQLVLMDLPAQDPLREEIKEIEEATQRAASLTQQLLAFSRQQVLQPEVLNLNAVILQAEKMLRRTLGEDIEFVTVLDPHVGRVKADRGQLEQILMNLAVNARDAMPDGGKLITETQNVELTEAMAGQFGDEVRPGSYVRLSVSDTGTGMPKEVRERIFEPFYTTKPQGKGTGLGLATVYGIVKQSGGYLWVYSEEGRGTTFKIYLPRAEAEPGMPAAGTPAVVPVPERTGTVLLVEDEPAVRRNARRILERASFRVLEAERGDEALRVAADHEEGIDLLLTDVVMPGMSGRELADRLSGSRPGMRVLFTSGYTDEAISQHGVLEPGIAFLQKPYGPEALIRKVAEVLDALDGGA